MMTYEGVVSAARSRASSTSSLEKPSACRYPMTWVSPSARTLPGPLATATLRNVHDASRWLGFARLGGCGPCSSMCLAAPAATLPPDLRLDRLSAPSMMLRGVTDGL